jgi:hypothetical protein
MQATPIQLVLENNVMDISPCRSSQAGRAKHLNQGMRDNGEAAADAQALCVRMASDQDVALRIAGDGVPRSLPLVPAAPLPVGSGTGHGGS